MKPHLRPATEADLPALLEIEQQSFSHPNWTADDFLENDCTVAEIDGEIGGFLVAREIFPGDATSPPEREILNLAVAVPFRRRGVASALLKYELGRKAICFLEVRESNLAAQKLYRKFGFTEIAERPHYYQHPKERAIVMKMKWC